MTASTISYPDQPRRASLGRPRRVQAAFPTEVGFRGSGWASASRFPTEVGFRGPDWPSASRFRHKSGSAVQTIDRAPARRRTKDTGPGLRPTTGMVPGVRGAEATISRHSITEGVPSGEVWLDPPRGKQPQLAVRSRARDRVVRSGWIDAAQGPPDPSRPRRCDREGGLAPDSARAIGCQTSFSSEPARPGNHTRDGHHRFEHQQSRLSPRAWRSRHNLEHALIDLCAPPIRAPSTRPM